jgi:hypothetical protein
MRDLPLNGRNPLQLVSLTTGAQDTGGGGNFQSANNLFAVNGNRGSDNTFHLDGANYTDVHYGTAPVLPSPDALEEFTVKSSNFSASESGAGASVLFSTRSGTNQFHGTAFEYLRNDALDSRNFFAATRTPFKRNQFGGTFGGPVIKDKTFFFASYQSTRLVGGASPTSSTPPPAPFRQGDFSSLNKPIVDPLTQQPFPGNMIPSSRFDPIAVKLLDVIELPNQPNGTYTTKPRTDQNDDQFSVRIDHLLSTRDHIAGRYFYDAFRFQSPTSPFRSMYSTVDFRNQNLLLSETHTFSPHLLMVASFGYTRLPRNQLAITPVTMQSLGAKVPLSNPSDQPQLSVSIGNYANLSSGTPLIPAAAPSTSEYRARFTWAHGKHMVQFGMDLIHDTEYARSQNQEAGAWQFDGSRTAVSAFPNSGDAFADFLLGAPFLFLQHGSSAQDIYETKWQPWIQDDWRIAPRLTLNLGLRWEPSLPATDRAAPQVGFEPGVHSIVAPFAPTGLVFSGDPGLRHSILPSDWNNLAPRIGFAWDAQGNGKMVVRGAYGIFYRPVPLNLARFSGNIAAFRGLSVSISTPPSFGNPYANYAGGTPFPWTPPSSPADLKKYVFVPPVTSAALDPHTSTSYAQQWNFTVERQIAPDLGVSLAYVGNHIVKGVTTTEANPAVYRPGATAANTDSRRIYPGLGSVQIVTGFEHAKYNALQLTVTRHAGHGLTLLANYVFSKCMDNNTQTVGGLSVINKFDPNKDYGRCDFNETHLATASLVYDLPRISAARGVPGKLVNNWTLTSILSAHSGLPFSVFSGRDNAFSGPTTNSGVNDLADQITARSSRPAGADFLQQWFNTTAYVQNAVGTFGDSGRNGLTAPGAWNWDFGLLKAFPVTERVRTEFRFEAFNCLNHANFGTPINTLTNRNFGKVLSASAPRVIQFSLRLGF